MKSIFRCVTIVIAILVLAVNCSDENNPLQNPAYNILKDLPQNSDTAAGKKAKKKNLMLWNTLDSETDIANSIIGPGGNVVGTVAFDPCKFDMGVKSLSLNDYVVFNDNAAIFPNPNQWTIEFWVKTEFDVVNGAASDNAYHLMLANINQQSGTFTGINFYFDMYRNPHPLRFDLYDGRTVQEGVVVTDNVSSWAAGDLVHLAVVADNSASFDGNKTAAIYVNGVQTASSTEPFSISSFIEPLVFGVYLYQSREYLGDCYMDNIRIWNCAKTDFKDRFKKVKKKIKK
jgi:hypothetical protein